MTSRTHVLLLAALVSVLALFAAACDDNEATSSSTPSQQSVDALAARVERNEMLFAVITIGTLPLHNMDEALDAGGPIESNFIPDTREAIRLLALTDWSSDLADEADLVRIHAVDLLAALEDDDVETAAGHAHDLHEGAHDFSAAVWAVLAASLPPDAGGEEEHEETEGTEEAGHGDEASPVATP
ncbi:MAG: hypothetical protein WEC75_07165 [Dehalococcoidia bacterium]